MLLKAIPNLNVEQLRNGPAYLMGDVHGTWAADGAIAGCIVLTAGPKSAHKSAPYLHGSSVTVRM